MALSVDQFVAKWNGKLVNFGGTQCVAVANQFNLEVVEGGWIGTPITGFAIDWWTNFGNDVDFNNYVKIGAGEVPQKGDIAIWTKYPTSKLPHIAVVLEVVGGKIRCFTQNPGKAHIEDLTLQGLAGYLRPKRLIVAAPKPAPAVQPVATPVAQPAAPAAFNVGDVVVPTALVDYNGTGLTQYDPSYTISEVIGDRAVLTARGAVWAAMNIANIRRA